MDTSPSLNSGKAGYHYCSIEALVQGWGWEGHEGDEPPASVLSMAGGKEVEGICVACWGWTGILMSKDRRDNLRTDIVGGADHIWSGCHYRIGKITDNWLT